MRLCHNMASLNVFRTYTKSLKSQSTSLDKLVSGYKVRVSKDDPNVVALSEENRIKIKSLEMASRNAQDGISLLQTAEGALDEIGNMANRMRELVVQAGGATTEEDRKILQKEIEQLKLEIDNTSKNTQFNGKNILNSDDTLKMTVGANVGDVVDIKLQNFCSSGLANKFGDIKIDDSNDIITQISTSLGVIDEYINNLVNTRTKFGALENRFETTVNSTSEICLKMEDSDSKMRDCDVAEEMMKYTKDNLLVNSDLAIMYQTNNFPQDVLKILDNIRTK